MLKDKTLSMLGLARRAGRLSMGHDMAQKALLSRKAKALIFCRDVSPRLVREFENTIQTNKIDVPVFKTELTIEEIHFFVGYKAGVITVNDENFSKQIILLLKQEEHANGN
ncbi:MAG: L7Ae/L30e/S12e/Gadd45 family ribosomal protein [Eubacterium sp.]